MGSSGTNALVASKSGFQACLPVADIFNACHLLIIHYLFNVTNLKVGKLMRKFQLVTGQSRLVCFFRSTNVEEEIKTFCSERILLRYTGVCTDIQADDGVRNCCTVKYCPI